MFHYILKIVFLDIFSKFCIIKICVMETIEQRMVKMQNTNSNRNVAQTTSISLSQRHKWSISALLSIIRFINYRFTPPFHKFNICNNISVSEQANIGDVRQPFVAPACSLSHLERFVAGYFVCRRWDISISYLKYLAI